jgi:hypothetical protein
VPSIEEILGKIKVPVRAVQICLDADLQAEHDELSAHLEVLLRNPPTKMSQAGKVRELAEQIRALEERMRASEVSFRFRALTKDAFDKIREEFPPLEGSGLTWNVGEGTPLLLAASAISPVMTEDQAKELIGTVSAGHAERMVGAAFLATTGSTQVPFSARASELTGGTGQS